MEEICGPGVDPKFDQLILALGHIARQKPKPLIDTLMLWRKGKSEAATSARAEANQVSAGTSDDGSLTKTAVTAQSQPAHQWGDSKADDWAPSCRIRPGELWHKHGRSSIANGDCVSK